MDYIKFFMKHECEKKCRVCFKYAHNQFGDYNVQLMDLKYQLYEMVKNRQIDVGDYARMCIKHNLSVF